MKISILIPCHNEEKSIQKCVQSCLDQTRKADQIVVVNDGSTDRSRELLEDFRHVITIVNIPKATGNKSYAQQHGLQFVTGDVFIATDGDTMLDPHFVEETERSMRDESIAAVGGCVKSLRLNWLTSCRAFEYTLGQNLHKLAQSYINFMFVIPGAAGAFRTALFKEKIRFDHDTITEDLDFTYKFHELGLKIAYNRSIVSYTQDPTTIHAYINQMRRWYGGGYQNLLKHFRVVENPVRALELSLVYIEGLVFSALMFVMPLVNLQFSAYFIASYALVITLFVMWASVKEHRLDLLIVPFIYPFIILLNAGIFLEQFIKEIILHKRNLVWFQPDRIRL
jgi:cellulose synthase/poly-beta-1,6-N-acetylglucosamine synthase-like glycosyltransferase